MTTKAATKTDERLAIPARPAAITTVNVAALAALGVAATGVGGAIVAAGAVAAGGAAIARSKSAAKRASRTSATTGSRGRSTPSATGGRKTGALGKLSSLGRSRKTGAATAGKGTATKGTTGKSPATKTTGHRSTPSGSGSRTSPLRRAASKMGLGKIARTSTRAAKVGGATGAASSRRASAFSPIRKAAKWTAPKMKSAIKRAVTAGASTKPTDTKTNPTGKWAKARKFFQSSILRRKPKGKTKEQETTVAAAVARRNRPATGNGTAKSGVLVITRRAGRPVPIRTNTTLVTTPGGIPMRDAARQMWTYAASFEPRGMTAVIHELEDLPETLSHVAGAVGALMEKTQGKFPLDPAIAGLIGQVLEGLYAAAAVSKKIPAAVHEIHGAEIKRLSQPRQGEEMWDLASNGRV